MSINGWESVCFATAWRIHQVIFVSSPSAQREFSSSVVGDALWSGLEINLGIINACLPLIPPALQQIGKHILPKALHLSKWRSTKDSRSLPRTLPIDVKRVSNATSDNNQKLTDLRSSRGGDESMISEEFNISMDARSTEDFSLGGFRWPSRFGVDDWEDQHFMKTNYSSNQSAQV